MLCLNLMSIPHPSPDKHLNEGYLNNTCILSGSNPQYFKIGGCSAAVAKNSTAFAVTMGNNRVYAYNKNISIDCKDVASFEDWLNTGADKGTQVFDSPSGQEIIQWGQALLSPVDQW